jgi:hypothetical protein
MSATPLPKITVVIPAYKAERTIARAIDSVLAQEGVEVAVKVIVNPEPDRTPQIVEAYGDPRVRVFINDENVGAQRSRNRGLEMADTEFVHFLCADDFVEGPFLSGLAREMTAHRADLGLGRMQTLFESKGVRGPTTILKTEPVQELFTNWLGHFQFVTPCAILWRTEFVRNIGGWDPDVVLQDDGLLVMKAILRGARVVGSNEGLGVYVIHDSPTKLTRNNDKLDSLLKVPAKLMAIESDVIEPEVFRGAAAATYYRAAQTCFTRGRDDLGREALRRSREMGLKGHRGPAAHRLLSSLIGLKARCKLEYAARRVLRRPGG